MVAFQGETILEGTYGVGQRRQYGSIIFVPSLSTEQSSRSFAMAIGNGHLTVVPEGDEGPSASNRGRPSYNNYRPICRHV